MDVDVFIKQRGSDPKIIVASVRAYVSNMSADDRIDFFSLLLEGYCSECGADEVKYGKCYCGNDV